MAQIPAAKASIKVTVEMGRFNAALTNYILALSTDAEKTVEASAFKLEGMIKGRTPVKTGRARASWHTVTFRGGKGYAYSAKGKTYDGTLKDSPKNPLQAIVGSNVEYMLALEAGHSRQAPAGMVRISAEELRGSLRAAVKSMLAKRRRLTK